MYAARIVDRLLNGITMYRLVVYVLGVWAALGLAFSAGGVLHFSLVGLSISLLLALGVCYVANLLLSWIWNVGTNTESWLITALILFCIMPPATTASRIAGMIAAAAVAMGGKFIVAIHGRHIFNPAAFGAVAAGLLGLAYAGWWIGSAPLLPFVLAGGLLVVRKLRRMVVFGCFVAVALTMLTVVTMLSGGAVAEAVRLAVLSGPLVFFGTIMLTEPSTLPPRRDLQLIYAALIGVLFSAQLRWGVLSTTPHMVLVAGNIFSWAISSKRRIRLELHQKRQIGPRLYDYIFTVDARPPYQAGQYMEWTLPHAHADDRGNRRTFTIASSPTEDKVHLGVKFYEPSSSFKRALFAMEPGEQLWAGHITGDFVLPADTAQPLVWIAGGIGITPFRSMMQYMVDTKQRRDVVLFYAVSNPDELVYTEVADAAAVCGVRLIPVLTANGVPKGWNGLTGVLTADMIAKEVPDYATRHFYLSGPNAMVMNYRSLLHGMHIPRRRVTTDYFSGY